MASQEERGQRCAFGLGLAVLAAVLAFHIHTYWFLTDDAFISCRYARNLAEGAGLVYNPGSQPVEGYTDFLWVVLLAAGVRLGLAAERAAPWLGVAATAAVWFGTALVGWRTLPSPRRFWLGLLAPLALAANRGFAVWSTSGLETRFCELLVFAGLGMLYVETRRLLDTGRSRPPWSAVILSLAVLTRLDAILIAGGALLWRDVLLRRRGRFVVSAAVGAWLLFLVPIAAHFVWRLAYYGYPLPNTYYAKLDGEFAGGQGLLFILFFVVEYALVLWTPFLLDGARAWRQRLPSLGPMLLAGFVPYLAYVVYAGGDHFEFRMLDLVWVPLVLLLQAGVAHRSARLRGRTGALLFAAAVAAIGLSAVLPTLSHSDYPVEVTAGFPGLHGRPNGDQSLVPVTRFPQLLRPLGVAAWVEGYNSLARLLTSRFVALRQEEHAGVVALTTSQGQRLRRLIDAGYIPEDTKIAIGVAGAIPYYSRLWTLDRVGLCDSRIAHGPWTSGNRMMAHGKLATPQYIAASGVDLDAVNPTMFVVTDRTVRHAREAVTRQDARDYYVARLGADTNFLAHFPLGAARELPRFPRLPFVPIAEWEQPGGNGSVRNQ